jgi:hypothetical protein
MAPSATGLVGVHGFDLARDAAVELQVLVCECARSEVLVETFFTEPQKKLEKKTSPYSHISQCLLFCMFLGAHK